MTWDGVLAVYRFLAGGAAILATLVGLLLMLLVALQGGGHGAEADVRILALGLVIYLMGRECRKPGTG